MPSRAPSGPRASRQSGAPCRYTTTAPSGPPTASNASTRPSGSVTLDVGSGNTGETLRPAPQVPVLSALPVVAYGPAAMSSPPAGTPTAPIGIAGDAAAATARLTAERVVVPDDVVDRL